MNVLFAVHCDFTGNSAMHVFSIANALLKNYGVRSVVAVPHNPESVRTHGKPGFPVVHFDEAIRNGVLFAGGGPPDLIHAWTPRENVRKFTQAMVERYGCPYVVHMEDNERVVLADELRPFDFRSFSRLPLVLQDQLVAAHRTHPTRGDDFIAGSAGVTALMDRLLELKPPEIPGTVFWPGFEPEFLHPAEDPSLVRERLGISPQDKVLVYCGNAHRSNEADIESLLAAVDVLQRRGARVKLVKTGWNYALQDQLRQASDAGWLIDLQFVPREQIATLVSIADVLVQPGGPGEFNDFRFPSKLPEYFASGKPVILARTNVGRFVRDREECLLMEHGHALEIAAKIDELFSNPELCKRIGLGGRHFAIEHLNWERNVQPIVELYEAATSHEITRVPARQTPPFAAGASLPVKAIAFYLPQFHPIKENDSWWGPGFTEWTNVVRGKPMFPGHHQPQLPADLGFYDLRAPDVMQQQAEMARHYGIHGFCFYYYWFNGKKLLERPLEMLLATRKPDFPFCLCWANENWTRAWDGSEDEILMKQQYSAEADEALIMELIPIFKDPRYIRVGDAPLFLVYRVNSLPDPEGTAARWRSICRREGIPSLHLVMVQTFGVKDPRNYGCDAAVEFPPHVKRRFVAPRLVPGLDSNFQGHLDDYSAVAEDAIRHAIPEYTWYRGVMPAWDNTARRKQRAHIFVRSSPALYAQWLSAIVEQAMGLASLQAPLVFINAWNEWAEGAHIEPDQRHGRAHLEATRQGLCTGIANSYKSEGLNVTPEGIERVFTPARAQDGNGGRQTGAVGGSMRKTDCWFDDAALETAYRRYAAAVVPRGLSYATVRDYCDSFDFLNPITVANGDLKDVQRPWAFKTILSLVPRGGRLLEIGAGEPWVADLLNRLGYEVWIVDPYDGSGNGPEDFARFSAECPQVSFVRDQFNDRLLQLPEHSFDCIYSISVLEHVPIPALHSVAAGLRRFLKPDGISIHAVDHVHRGKAAEEHLEVLKVLTRHSGIPTAALLRMLAEMDNDIETYYLSAESHNRWRAQLPYDQFQMRRCVSIQLVTEAKALSSLGEYSS